MPRPFSKIANIGVYYIGFDNKKPSFSKGLGREIRETASVHVWKRSRGWDYDDEAVTQWDLFAACPYGPGRSRRIPGTHSIAFDSARALAFDRMRPAASRVRSTGRSAPSMRSFRHPGLFRPFRATGSDQPIRPCQCECRTRRGNRPIRHCLLSYHPSPPTYSVRSWE
jgi:hypothetical protein